MSATPRFPCPVCGKLYVNVAEHHTKIHAENVLYCKKHVLRYMGRKLRACGCWGTADPHMYIPVFEGWKHTKTGGHTFVLHYNTATKTIVKLTEQLSCGTNKNLMITNIRIKGEFPPGS